ncbi:MAG: M28 family peptidase [Bacteroidia bacterium]|nr:M28 family peptidase [Bacteroidia bacterium]
MKRASSFFLGFLRIFLLLPLSAQAQTTKKENDSLHTLLSLQRDTRKLCRFEGRGHGTAGSQKAASYIAARLREMRYKPHLLTYSVRVHLISDIRLSIWKEGGKWTRWVEGKTYIPAPDCPSVVGEWEVDTLPQTGKAWWVPSTIELTKALKTAIQNGVTCLLIPREKLTAGAGTEAGPLPILYVKVPAERPDKIRLRVSAQTRWTSATNVMAVRAGKSSDSAWVVGAHYDHLGKIGKAVFWGANDNASGVAFLLSLAERVQNRTEPPPYDIWWVAFGAEELGLLGSRAWVETPPYPLERLKGMLNFDLVGFGEKGVAVVGASDQVEFWKEIDWVRIRQGWNPPLLLRPNAPNSDHFPFREKGVRALFFYLQGGPGYYHDIYDRPETLSWAGAYPLLQWIEGVLFKP